MPNINNFWNSAAINNFWRNSLTILRTPPKLTLFSRNSLAIFRTFSNKKLQQSLYKKNVGQKNFTKFLRRKNFQVTGKNTMGNSPKVWNSEKTVGLLRFHTLLTSLLLIVHINVGIVVVVLTISNQAKPYKPQKKSLRKKAYS